MGEQALSDVSTVGVRRHGGGDGSGDGSSGDGEASLLVPALTIVSHPVPPRAGERLLLEALLKGREVSLSRNAPDFMHPAGGLAQSLSDAFLSRKPVVFSASPGGGIRLDPGENTQLAVAGKPLTAAQVFSPEEVSAGVALELAERIVLLLHLADPKARGTPDSLGMVGASVGLQRVRSHITQVADLNVPVLIRGETGSGKELIAQAIHKSSPRRAQAFVSVNLAAIPKDLATAELFGASKGSFTGAVRDQKGFFLAADGGTLFLDEVGEAPPEVQVMLLRVLETGEIYPVGERVPVKVNVRLVAATDAQLEKQIREGRFKEPLLHRLAGYEIRVPPLRERREDIGLLFYHFAREELEAIGEGHRLKPESSPQPWLPVALASRLVRSPWPGNIRQLRNVTRQIIIGSRGQPELRLDPRLEQELSPPASAPGAPANEWSPQFGLRPPARRKISHYTEEEIVAALEKAGWEKKPASEKLGVARSSLYEWLQRNPHIRAVNLRTLDELRRCYQELQGDLEAMARQLEVVRWALAIRLKELDLI
jgi:two-component system nitrogen regulation response regulator GlnG